MNGITGIQDDGMFARANKIRAIFNAQINKEQDSFPGISRGKTGMKIIVKKIFYRVVQEKLFFPLRLENWKNG